MEPETKKEVRTCLLYLNDLYKILWKRQRAGLDLDPRFGNDRAVLYLENVERLKNIRERFPSNSYDFARLSTVIQFFECFYLDIQNKKFVDSAPPKIPPFLTTYYK